MFFIIISYYNLLLLNIGVLPWNEANKIPTMSHWLADVAPFYPCCMWQDEQSNGCQSYR